MSQIVRLLGTAGLLLLFSPPAALAQATATDAAAAIVDGYGAGAAATAADAAADATIAAQRGSTYGIANGRASPAAVPRTAPAASRQLGGVLSGVLGSYLGSNVAGPREADLGEIVGSVIRNATQVDGARSYQAPPDVRRGNLPAARSPGGSSSQLDSDVRWIRRPDGRDVVRYYPDRAARLGIRGTATMHCSVTASGYLENCTIASESPAGHDFGNALVRMHRLFRAEPMTIGEPGSDRIIPIQIRFGPAIG